MKYFLISFLLFIYYPSSFAQPTCSEPINLTFGIYTSQKPSTQVKIARPILTAIENLMSKDLNCPVKIKMQVSNTYEATAQQLLNQSVDFARLGAASTVLILEDDPDIKLLGAENEKGSKYFNGVIAVKDSSPIKSLSDLIGKSFAFGSSSSTIGRFLAQKVLSENGIYSSSLGNFDYLGRHDLVGSSVSLRKFDAGALNEKVFNTLNGDGHQLRSISTFPVLTRTWVSRSELPEHIVKCLKKILLQLSDKETLKPMNIEGFLDVSINDLQDVKKAILENDQFFKNGSNNKP